MVNNLRKEEQKLYEKIITIESFDNSIIYAAKERFNQYRKNGIIIESEFDDTRWQLSDEYSNVGIVFDVNELMYRKLYMTIFELSYQEFIILLKAYTAISLGNNVLISVRNFVNDVKKFIAEDYKNVHYDNSDLKMPFRLLEFLLMIPTSNSKEVNEIVSILETIHDYQIKSHSSKRRRLAEFESYFRFNDYLEMFWDSIDDLELRLFYYPIYLWWNISAILPLRPREFLLTPRDCINKKNGKYYLTLRRNRLKGSSGEVNYNIDQDYIKITYEIPESIYTIVHEYIIKTDSCEQNELHTLLRTEPHYKRFEQKKHVNSRFFTYVNLSTVLRTFYEEILRQKYGLNVIRSKDKYINLTENDIEFIYLGDTRHIAMINIIAEGATPHIAMQLAGHADITMSSHYYANIANLIECKTYRKYRALTKGNEKFEFGTNYYPLSIEEEYTALEHNSRCYSSNFYKGKIDDCEKATGNHGELGYCPKCPFYRSGHQNTFLDDKGKYIANIKEDANYLRHVLSRFQQYNGGVEDIQEAILRLENSTFNYKNFYMQKLVQDEREM